MGYLGYVRGIIFGGYLRYSDALVEKHGEAAAATIAELKAVHAEGSAKWYEYQQWKLQLIFITFLPIYFFGNMRQNFIK